MNDEYTSDPSQPEAPAEPMVAAASNAASSSKVCPPSNRIAVSALSDIGCVRTNNEDFLGYDETIGIYVVCDGMGGMASGEVASSLAVAAILKSFAASAASGVPVSSRLLHAITIAAALDGDKLILGNVGDSRAYIIQDGKCTQLTVDHSYINELIRNGTLTLENANSADLKGMESIITRAVGVAADVQPDFFSVDLTPGTGILLATDGLTRYVEQDEISTILNASTFDSACANLINVAKERGGQDNVTCILLLVLPS